jgi:hypothetical protein
VVLAMPEKPKPVLLEEKKGEPATEVLRNESIKKLREATLRRKQAAGAL